MSSRVKKLETWDIKTIGRCKKVDWSVYKVSKSHFKLGEILLTFLCEVSGLVIQDLENINGAWYSRALYGK